MEYHLSILEEKAREGVDVRFIYDDMGCMLTLPKGYDQLLEKRAFGARSLILWFQFFQPNLIQETIERSLL